jgi:hypothetical protein
MRIQGMVAGRMARHDSAVAVGEHSADGRYMTLHRSGSAMAPVAAKSG